MSIPPLFADADREFRSIRVLPDFGRGNSPGHADMLSNKL